MAPLEVAVVRSICALLARRGAWFVKTTGVGLAGCPDLLACYRGYFIALEVKREENGKYGATTKQAHELRMVRRAGGYSLVVSNARQVKELLDEIDAE